MIHEDTTKLSFSKCAIIFCWDKVFLPKDWAAIMYNLAIHLEGDAILINENKYIDRLRAIHLIFDVVHEVEDQSQ